MAGFDIINAAAQAYKTTWEARAYLVRLALVPFFLKLVCFTIAVSVTDGENGGGYLRFMLIMVPSLIAEGWMLSHYVRFIVFGQTWPFRPTGNIENDLAVLKVRARGVMGGMIVFVLINLALGFLMAVVGQYLGPYLQADGGTPPQIPVGIALFSFVMMGAMVWGFRLVWLYIPFAVGMSGRDYLRGVRGVQPTVHMIAIWILCFVPFMFGLQLVLDVVGTFPGQAVLSFVTIIFTVLADTLKGIVATAGLTYGLREMFTRKRKP